MAEEKKDEKKHKKHKLDRGTRLIIVLVTFFLTFWAIGLSGPWFVSLIAAICWTVILYPFLKPE